MLVPNKIYCLIFFVNTFTGDIFNTSIIKLSYKPYSPFYFYKLISNLGHKWGVWTSDPLASQQTVV